MGDTATLAATHSALSASQTPPFPAHRVLLTTKALADDITAEDLSALGRDSWTVIPDATARRQLEGAAATIAEALARL